MRAIACLVLVAGLLPGSPLLGSQTETSIAEPTQPCRDTFPEVVANPNEEGGWRLLELNDRRLLCIYGSLPPEVLPGLLAVLDRDTPLTIIVRSTGGPAESWLSLAEHLSGWPIDLIVDEACFSSCANYLPVIALSILAAKNSLLVWHGGPSSLPGRDAAPEMANLAEFIIYDDLSRRTRRLYAKHGVSTELLRVSDLRTSEALLDELTEALVRARGRYSVAGYAFSPETLADCFNLTTAEHMWHAGDDSDLIRLAQKRNPDLLVLESPKTVTGERICTTGFVQPMVRSSTVPE